MALVILSPTARRDLVDILLYLRSKSHRGARRVHVAIRETCEFLAANPRAGPSRNELTPGIRSYPTTGYRDYLIFYRPISGGVQIARVLHGSRNLPRFF